jgi:hypothetical protein
MSDDVSNRMAAYLEENPRMIGVLFTVMVLLSQAGSALAGGGTTTVGP